VNKIIEQIKANKNYQYGLGAAAMAIILFMAMSGDNSDDDPYADLSKPQVEGVAPVESAGINIGGMMDDEVNVIPPAEIPEPQTPSDMSFTDVQNKPVSEEKKVVGHGNHKDTVNHKKLDSVKKKVLHVAESFVKTNQSGERDIDSLVENVDGIIQHVLMNFDMDKIRGDALKGTTSEQETLKRLEVMLDMTTLIQQKRLALLEATKNIKLARIDPKRMILREITPLRVRLDKLEKKTQSANKSLALINTELTASRKRSGATVLASSTSKAFKPGTKTDLDYPELAMIMHEGKKNTAHLKYRDQVFKLTKKNQTVGTWKVLELHANYLVIESLLTKKKFILSMAGHEPMKKGGLKNEK